MAKRGETRPYRVEYRWPTMPRPGVITETTSTRALDTARRQALTVGGTTGERDCLVRIVYRDRPAVLPIYLRACPSCEELTAWASGEWRHVGHGRLCSDATNPVRADEEPELLWNAVDA